MAQKPVAIAQSPPLQGEMELFPFAQKRGDGARVAAAVQHGDNPQCVLV